MHNRGLRCPTIVDPSNADEMICCLFFASAPAGFVPRASCTISAGQNCSSIWISFVEFTHNPIPHSVLLNTACLASQPVFFCMPCRTRLRGGGGGGGGEAFWKCFPHRLSPSSITSQRSFGFFDSAPTLVPDCENDNTEKLAFHMSMLDSSNRSMTDSWWHSCFYLQSVVSTSGASPGNQAFKVSFTSSPNAEPKE